MRLKELVAGRVKPTQLEDGELYQFEVNGKYTLRLRSFHNSHYFYLYAKVIDLPNAKATKKLLEGLLRANVFSGAFSNAYFAWHKESAKLLLMAAFDTKLETYQELHTSMEEFISLLVYWQKKLSALPDKFKDTDILDLLGHNKGAFRV